MTKAFSLLNGKEIVATIVEETDEFYVVENAIAFFFKEDEATHRMMIFPFPASYLAEPKQDGLSLKIFKHSLAFAPFDVGSELLNIYKQQKSPIQMPETSAMMGQFTR